MHLTLSDAADLARQCADFVIVLAVFSGVTHLTRHYTARWKHGKRAARYVAIALDIAIVAVAVALHVLAVESLKDAAREILIDRDEDAAIEAVKLTHEEI